VATLDHLSNGRVDLGVGEAITEDEFENLGVDFKSRGRRCNDALAALKALWTEEVPTHNGEFYSYAGLKFSPKPKQSPHPPIVVGGGTQAALRRTARFGDGWHALRQTPNQIRAALATLGQMTEAQGRDPDRLQISIRIPVAFDVPASRRPPEDQTSLKGKASDLAATICAYRDAGVHEIVMSLGSDAKSAHVEMLERLSQEVRPLLMR
jgi:alkanesulfonate monooxygenase SsuD/methylene tetrahydromethanopterin reductase-like flavin-dependent oxidoreductase (luciferase family)